MLSGESRDKKDIYTSTLHSTYTNVRATVQSTIYLLDYNLTYSSNQFNMNQEEIG